MITAAIIEPIAMVEAKSKLDILANVRNPNILVNKMINEKIARTDNMSQRAS